MMIKRYIFLVTLVTLLSVPRFLHADEPKSGYTPATIEGNVTWKGEVHVEHMVNVPSESLLIISAGTKVFFHAKGGITVKGNLQINGSKGNEVVLDASDELKKKGEKFSGVKFIQLASRNSHINRAVIRNAVNGISCNASSLIIKDNIIEDCTNAIVLWQESMPLIESNRIMNCVNAISIRAKSDPVVKNNFIKDIKDTGVKVTQSSKPKISNNTFINLKIGISTNQGVTAEITSNSISGAAIGIYTYQVGQAEKIIGNKIFDCEKAIYCDSFSSVHISDNLIESNVTGIAALQFSSPEILNNEITGNAVGIVTIKKSNPKIEMNNITDNDKGIVIDYTSYPAITNNNIIDNDLDIGIGMYQSSDWENRGAGSASIVKDRVKYKQSRVDFNKVPAQEYTGNINVTGNYWGSTVTREMDTKGAAADISTIYDYYDKNTIVYEGWGDTEYELDKVKYDGWLKSEIKESGRKGPGQAGAKGAHAGNTIK